MNDRLWTFDCVRLAGRPAPRLEELSVAIRPGVTAVVGHSGAGKTSLLNLLAEFEKPDAGRISRHIAAERRLPLFWLPQDDGLWPGVSARQHLTLVMPDSSGSAADELLDAFDLTQIAAATPDRLSRGEASRLALARAIASDSAVLVLDEPLAHVDPARRGTYWERLVRYTSERSASLVFASHEPADVLRYATHVIALQEGRLLFEGDVRTLYEAPPDEIAARLLGPVNWLADADRIRWRVPEDRSPCVRPERLALEPAADGVASVLASRSAGPLMETSLRHGTTGETRSFVHATLRNGLAPGARVRLAVFALIAAVSLPGCFSSSEGPRLEVASERRFALPAKGTLLPAPRDVAVGRDDEKIILDNAGRVLVYDAAGELVRQWDMPESSVGNPEGACRLADGRICVADTHYHRVVFFDDSGNVAGMFGSLGREDGQFIYPVAVTTDDKGNLFVAEYGGNDRIQKFAPDGTFLAKLGSFGTGEGQFQRPSGITWLDGTLYVADAFNGRIHVFSDSGEHRGLLGSSDLALHYPYDLSLGPDGLIYVVEYGAGRVTLLSTKGELVARYGSTGSGPGQFTKPWGLAVDSKGRVWVADTENRRVVELIPADSAAEGESLVVAGFSQSLSVARLTDRLKPVTTNGRLLGGAQ